MIVLDEEWTVYKSGNEACHLVYRMDTAYDKIIERAFVMLAGTENEWLKNLNEGDRYTVCKWIQMEVHDRLNNIDKIGIEETIASTILTKIREYFQPKEVEKAKALWLKAFNPE